MRVVDGGKIAAYLGSCGPAEKADVTNWRSNTQSARWLGPADVTAMFPAAVNHGGGSRWEFPMPRSTARVFATVRYTAATVLVTNVT